jgi:hypothetical protein
MYRIETRFDDMEKIAGTGLNREKALLGISVDKGFGKS